MNACHIVLPRLSLGVLALALTACTTASHPVKEGASRSNRAMPGTTCMAPQASANGIRLIDQCIVGESYCLRDTSRDLKHVRQLVSMDSLLTDNHKHGVSVHYKVTGRCGTISASDQIQDSDKFAIYNDGSGYWIRIIHGTDRPWAEKLTPNQGKDLFYATATHAELDYFVMLLDDDMGAPASANVQPIEKYYLIETFLNDRSACVDERPDKPDPLGVANFTKWTGPQNDACIVGGKSVRGLEVGSGSGGQEHP